MTYVTLRTGAERIEDQGAAPTCMRFSITTALEIIAARSGNPLQLSTQYVQAYSAGAYNVPAIIQQISPYGICLDSSFPYNVSTLGAFPSWEAMQEGQKLVPEGSLQMRSVPGVESICRSIDEGSPVIVTIIDNPEYFWCVPPGKTWRETAWDIMAPRTGEHEVVIVGYDTDALMFEVIGSFGPYAFDKGVHGIPFSYVRAGVVTSADRFTKTPWPLTPPASAPVHAIARWEDNKLYIPRLFKYNGYGKPSPTYLDAVCIFPTANYGQITWDVPGASGYDNMYRVRANELMLAELFILKSVYRDVRILGSDFTVESYAGEIF